MWSVMGTTRPNVSLEIKYKTKTYVFDVHLNLDDFLQGSTSDT